MTTQLVLLGLLAAACVTAIVWLVLRRRVNPEEHERRRRLELHRHGRMSDGTVIDIDGDTLQYQYSVRGIDYVATQDVTALTDRLPVERHTLIGPVTLKFSTRNPANSIVVCENWSGLRIRSHVMAAKETR